MKPYSRNVRYYETDQMGVVHHSNYIRFFEEARMDFWDQMGLSYDRMEKAGILVPVLACSCHYKKPLRFPQSFSIAPHLETFNGVRFRMTYRVFTEGVQQAVAFGESEHCFADRRLHPLRIEKHHPWILELIETLLLQQEETC